MNIHSLKWYLLTLISAVALAEEQRRLEISENAPVGSLVGKIHDTIGTDHGPAYILVYPPESQVDQTFVINDHTGEIKTKIPLDYESRNSYVFLAIPTSDKTGGSGDGIRVIVDVKDVNDCAPEFPQKYIQLQLSEYAKIGSETPLPSAVDRDGSEKYGLQKYELISGNVNNAFRLGVRRLNRLLYADLIVNSELDRELLDHYTLEIRASDGGEPTPLTDTLKVNISILDANDNTPIFDQTRYIAKLQSNATIGSEVIRVHAEDKDLGDNGIVDYRFLPSPLDAQKWFSIDPSGRIILSQSIAQSHKQYELFVAARDHGFPQPLESTSFVTVNILDLDEHKPDIKVIYLSDDGRPVVSESAEIGSLLARVSVSDPDQKDLETKAEISMEGDDDTFGVKESSDVVYLLLKKRLDREVRQNYTLTILANIRGAAYKRSLVIKVADINDNAPRFKQQFYEAEIREKSTPGSSVLRVEAIDMDEAENGAITYGFASSNAKYAHWLDIDPETGLISIADTLDCEISSRPEFTLTAIDHGKPPLSATAKLTITVLDVNDNPPSFLQALYNVSVREDAEIGYCFLKVQANDPDCGVNAQIHYKLSSDSLSDSAYPFKVDENTGNVCLSWKLDFETRRIFQFPVLAYDGGGLYGSTMVILSVEDTNDNAPIFYPAAYNVTVRRDALPGTPMLIVSAQDMDEGHFGTITYTIAAGNEESKFRINKSSGELFVDQRLSVTIYQLHIQAMDGGGLTAIHPAVVTIMVSTEDYPSPQFDQKLYRFTVREDTLPGITIGTIHAVAPSGTAVTYSIYSGDPNENFTIDRQSGSISIVRYLDYEAQKLVLLNIQASTDQPPAFNHTQVEVIVEDVNDNSPYFERKFVRTTVSEDHAVQKTVFVCYADDRDGGKNGEIRYRLISNPGNAFMIHPISGEIRLTQQLDYEEQKNYTLIVLAQDGGIPSLSDNMTLEMDVSDVNDHEPRFALPQYRAIVSEDATTMTRIIQLHASDEDAGINGQITYRLDASTFASEGFPFRVFADNGWIYVRQTLDRKLKKEYSFTAVAKDTGQPSKSASVGVLIQISDINDHAPNCLSIQQLSISENRPAGTYVGRVKADDPDDGENGTVSYTLSNPSNSPPHFRLTQNGELYTEVVLDRENEPIYDLTVLATDHGTPALSSVCSIHVTISDENDQSPFFILPIRDRLYFREEQPKNTEVAQIRASDADYGENGTVRYRLEKSDTVPFNIDSITGVLSSTELLDYELGPKMYEITVVAEDSGQPARSSKRTFIIELVDIDDGGGSTNETINFDVSELAPVGYRIGLVDRHGQLAETDLNSLTDADSVDHSYEIMSGNSQGLFEINRLTSVLYLIKQLDYETSSAHFLIINKIGHPKFASPSGSRQSEIRVKVFVSDENDNAPTFHEDPVIFSVPENKAGFVVWQYNATDGDTGSFGRVEYRILEQYPNETGVFELDKVSGELYLRKELDFEHVAEYLLVIEAIDQAPNISQRRSGRVTTRIYVTDVNDCDPKFISRDHAYVFIDEPMGYPLIYVTAVDDDWLENGRVTYRLASGNENGQFNLNATSGALLLWKPLKREDGSREYRLTIVADDHGIPQRTSTQMLTVLVLDVDDYTLRFEQSVYRVNVTENGPIGVVVVQLRAHHPEGSASKELLYILPNGTAGNKFRMNEKTGTLMTTVPLDREEMDEYVLTVYVRDSSNSPRYDAATVVVTVEDMNDNTPVIGEATCREQSVPENQPFDVFHTIIATDRDIGSNGKLTYAITGGNVDGKMRINSANGEIACDALDREAIPMYNLTIQVRDNGSPSHTTQCTLPVYVLDVNDNNPRFEQSSYSAQVAENSPAGTTILRIRAMDSDEGLNGKIMYSIANETMGLFDIGANSGEIVVLGKLDYEQGNAYTFVVKAYDQGPSESKSDTIRVTVQILDVNDNAPLFANVPFVANVSSNIAAGQRVVKVVANDADGPGPNSEISYSLSNTDDNRFVINPTTGVISAKQHLQLSPSTVEYLNVVVTDHGDPPKSTTSVVEIAVDAGEESYRRSAIKFTHTSYKAEIVENSEAGTKVIDVHASSSTASTPIEYKIISGNENGAFVMDANTGTITVSDPSRLDYESNKIYQLVVEASVKTKISETAVDLQRAYVPVRIDVMDSNDHAPQFLQQRYSAAVSEGKAKGTFVIQVSATDGDIGENAALTYSIVSGNVDSAFAVDNSGIVKTNAELDREIHDRYTLTVMAADAGSPPKSGTAVIDVLVIDINDNSPSFPAIRPIKISESTEIGTLLATLTANDVDTFPPLVYSLTSKNNSGVDHFNLDRFTGRLVLAKQLDYEQDHEFDLEIQVSDSVYVTSARQKIIVLDENDNAPVFSQSFYQAALPLGAQGGTSVIHVSATDLDSGDNGRIQYSLIGTAVESFGFWIDATNGELFLNRTLGNRSEVPPIIQLTVAALDGGQPSKSAITTVQIQMGYVYEQNIDFASKSYRFTVSEDAPVHSVIGRITTTAGDRASKHVHYLIKSGDTNRTLSIDSDGNVILMKRLDREIVDNYELEITMKTKASGISNSTAKMIIQVTDVNDNWPVFEENEYSTSIRESTLPGTMILKLTAIDRDAGANGTIVYELLSGDVENALAIDSRSGTLSLIKSILGIAVNELRLIIRASDGGSPPRTSIAGVVVQIQKENTSAPVFPLQLYFGSVWENAPIGTMVLKVKGSIMAGHKSMITPNFTYSIAAGNEDGHFQLDAIGGELRTRSALDYEQKTFYRLMIVVSDTVGRWANTSAQILVRGIDEYAPEFTQNGFVFQTNYDATEGEIVGTVSATDKDNGADGKITYTLKDHTPYFQIHPETAVISVTSSLASFEDQTTPKSTTDPQSTPVKSVFVTVVAYSGPDVGSGKSNSTIVEIQIGHFKKSTQSRFTSASMIISISVGLILLLILILVLVVVKLRRRDNKPSLVHKMGKSRPNRSRKNRQLLKSNDVVQPCPKAASRAASGFHHHITSDNGNSLRPDPVPTAQIHISRTNVCDLSTKSSGRGSLIEENDGGKVSVASRVSVGHQNNFKCAPDSGIHAYTDDNGSITSELPSTQEYLTSLGVEATNLAKKQIECPRVSVTDSSNQQFQYDVVHQEDDIADVQDLIYSKVNEVLAGEVENNHERPSINDYFPNAPASDTVISPRTSWPAPLSNSGPSYQPLTQVFSEIARIKSDQDSLRRRPNNFANSSALNANSRNGSMNRSPSGWAPTNFASPDDPDASGAYAVAETGKIMGNGKSYHSNGHRMDRRSETELEIKI